MKEIVLSNDKDQYLDNPAKALVVKQWLKDINLGSGPLERFCELFPEDRYVSAYRSSPENKEALQLHIEIVQSQVPVAQYFDVHGLTDDKIVKTLSDLMDNPDPDIKLKALKLILKSKHLPQKPLRISPTQINIFNDQEKDAKVKTILKNIEALKSIDADDVTDSN